MREDTVRLELQNRTKLNLMFKYGDLVVEIDAQRSEVIRVPKGKQVEVSTRNGERVKKMYVEPDFFIHELDSDTTLRCDLIGWELQLKVSTPLL